MVLPPRPELEPALLAAARAALALRGFEHDSSSRSTRALAAMLDDWCIRRCEDHARSHLPCGEPFERISETAALWMGQLMVEADIG